MDEKELYQLFINIKNGDRKSFDLLYQHTWRPLFDMAMAKTRDQEEAKDIVQEIYTKIWVKKQELEIRTNVGAYLYRMTKHEIIRRLQAAICLYRQREVYRYAYEELSASLEDHLIAAELGEQWETEITKLPVKQREIYTMHYKLDFSVSEIATELGLAEQTVKNQLVLAKKKITTVIEASLSLYIISLALLG